MLEALISPVVNRLLRSNSWSLDTLRPHAGKVVVVSCPPTTLRLTVLDSGEVAPAGSEAAPATRINLTPGLLLRIAARDSSAWSAAAVTGDVEFAAAIDYVRRNLRWDYEEDLSRVFGDIAAHRMGNAARGFDRWARESTLNLAHAAAEYAVYEQPLLASRAAVEEFNREVDGVRDDAARLQKRISLLQQQLSAI
jgi:ubiquinone biosynthesis protein UbiJ